MTIFEHPDLGNLDHTDGQDVILFRNLKYASLKHPFAAPEVAQERRDIYDVKNHGPTPISMPNGCDMDLSLMQRDLPHGDFKSSGTECLNLNICIPKNNKGPLPVFVYIDGGGFSIGANAWPRYDLKRIVKYSAEIGKPLIGVHINYRLGIYGFLDSQALRKAGVPANRGLRDQVAAFQWIKKNIAGFGGDPEQITAIGQSGGGVSITLHLESITPVFNQFIAMGGSALAMVPLPQFVAEKTCETVLKKLSIDTKASGTEQLRALLNVSTEEVLKSIGPDLPMMPVVDGDVVPTILDFSSWNAADESSLVPGTKWCSPTMLGDCQLDGGILGLFFHHRKAGIATAFRQSLLSNLSGHAGTAEAICKIYGITTDVPDDESLKGILKCFTDTKYYAPTIEIAKAWPGSAFIYHFNEPNPWEGTHKGKSSHCTDVAFLFQNFNEHMSKEQEESARRFAKDVIVFVNGENPYPAHEHEAGGAQICRQTWGSICEIQGCGRLWKAGYCRGSKLFSRTC